jgi:hypothetical protein
MTTSPTLRCVTKAHAVTLNEVHRSAQRSASTLAVVTTAATYATTGAGLSGNPFHLVSALNAQVTTHEGGCAR